MDKKPCSLIIKTQGATGDEAKSFKINLDQKSIHFLTESSSFPIEFVDSNNEPYIENSNENDEKSSEENNDNGQMWTEKPTKLLISYYQELNEHVGKSMKLKTKKKMWEVIQQKMSLKGYNFSVLQIENRWKTLERSYRRVVDNNSKTRNKKLSSRYQRCIYFRELMNCIGKKPSTIPEYTLSNTDTNRNTDFIKEEIDTLSDPESVIEQPTEFIEDTVTTVRPKPAILKRKVTFAKMPDSKQSYYDKLLDIKRKKVAAYERRTAEISRKNDLFAQFLSVMAEKMQT